jgi:uncharacterized protein (TIGR00725 family)
MPYQVAVYGPRHCTDAEAAHARRLGELLAERGAVVICGGGGGVMAAVTAGAHSRNGIVVGIRPDDSRTGASLDLSVTVVTNLGEARNAVIVWSADAVIAVVPVISLGGWQVLDSAGSPVPGIHHVAGPEEAVRLALRHA